VAAAEAAVAAAAAAAATPAGASSAAAAARAKTGPELAALGQLTPEQSKAAAPAGAAAARTTALKCGGCGAICADTEAFQAHCSEVEHDDDFMFECDEVPAPPTAPPAAPASALKKQKPALKSAMGGGAGSKSPGTRRKKSLGMRFADDAGEGDLEDVTWIDSR
jgi:hypothetical protein